MVKYNGLHVLTKRTLKKGMNGNKSRIEVKSFVENSDSHLHYYFLYFDTNQLHTKK